MDLNHNGESLVVAPRLWGWGGHRFSLGFLQFRRGPLLRLAVDFFLAFRSWKINTLEESLVVLLGWDVSRANNVPGVVDPKNTAEGVNFTGIFLGVVWSFTTGAENLSINEFDSFKIYLLTLPKVFPLWSHGKIMALIFKSPKSPLFFTKGRGYVVSLHRKITVLSSRKYGMAKRETSLARG